MDVRGQRILIFGDSLTHPGADTAPAIQAITAGTGRATSAPGDLLGSILLEQGAAAVQTDATVGRSALSYLQAEPSAQLIAADRAFAPTRVIVMLGTNDANRDLAGTERAMAQLRDAFKNMGAEVWAVGPMTYVGSGARLNASAANVFTVMQRVFGKDKTIDARPLSADVARAGDGIHFTSDGARTVAPRIASALLTAKPNPWPMIALVAGGAVALGAIVWALSRQSFGDHVVESVHEQALPAISGVGAPRKRKMLAPAPAPAPVRVEDLMHLMPTIDKQIDEGGGWANVKRLPGGEDAIFELVQAGILEEDGGFVRRKRPALGGARDALPAPILKRWKRAIGDYKRGIAAMEAGDVDARADVLRARERLRKLRDEAAAHVPGSYQDPALVDLDADENALPNITAAEERGREARYKAGQGEIKKLREEERGARPSWMRPLKGLAGTAIRPSSSTESQAGYVYHATNEERAQAISGDGLKTHGPSWGTDQDVWPDGSRERRSYWTRKASSAHYFAPEEGPAVLLRTVEDPQTMRAERTTGDIITTKTVPASKIEILTSDGWEPLKAWAAS